MEKPMARRLLLAGHSVHVHNRSLSAVRELVSQGARASNSSAEVASRAKIVLTALPTPDSVEAVYIDLAGAAHAGQIFVDHSTVNLGLNQHCAELLSAKGANFLDAPVSGGPAGAEAGSLTIMVGGDQAVFDLALPLFQAYGKNIRRCGPLGSGQAVKLVNQLLVAIHTAASAEAIVFGVKLGADPRVLLDVLGTSFGASNMLVRNLPRFISRDFSGATPIGLILKDLGLIRSEATIANVPLLLGALVEQLFVEARGRGMADDDMASLVQLVEQGAGAIVGSPVNDLAAR